jgi:hypothetical protein
VFRRTTAHQHIFNLEECTMVQKPFTREGLRRHLGLIRSESPYRDRFIDTTHGFYRDDVVYPFQANALELLEHLIDHKVWPIVDRKLGLIVGVGYAHAQVKAGLYRLFHCVTAKDLDDVVCLSNKEASDLFIHTHQGYAWSSCVEQIVISRGYVGDEYDADILNTFERIYAIE